MAKKSAPSVAYFEEVDDDDKAIPGTEPKYARSTAHSSPSKEKPNTSKTRKDSNRKESKPPITALSDSDTTEPLVRRDSKLKMKEEKRRAPLVNQKRPSARSNKTAPAPSSRISDESSYYGVPPAKAVSSAPSRPRARTRPESYYGQRPPMSTSAYAHQPPHPSQLPPPSYPPAPWMGGPHPPPMGHALVHQPIPSPSIYGDMPPPPNRDLASRFRRPQSAMGFQQPPKPIEYEPTKEKALARRTSVARKTSKNHEDRERMPPPARPASTQPANRLVFRPPPPSHTASRRKSVGFEDDDLLDADPSMYKAVARRDAVEYGSGALPSSRQRRQSFDADSTYEVGSAYELEPASRGRRNSFYNLEEKVRDASRYQEDVSGGPAPPLTAEALRRVKNGGSSRSTRSSQSRDESDYKQSATTRTTRSSSGDDDITIKLPMGAVIEVGNTKIHCKDGGDINIGRNAPRGGSDNAASNYSDERKSRGDRAERRTRASSQAGSFSRTRSTAPPLYPPGPPTYSHYDDPYDHYDRYAPPYLGYNEDDDEEDDDYFD
ncbi:hypothetical protein F4804DRAFT_344921 [Jackrogersella minutella]|nr:hypothetical protein F4804DRAFT_344921 [Jackrogersella minutella]